MADECELTKMRARSQNIECPAIGTRLFDYFDRSVENDIERLSAFSFMKDDIPRKIFFFNEIDKQFPEKLLAYTLKEGPVTECSEMGFPGCVQRPSKISSHYFGI